MFNASSRVESGSSMSTLRGAKARVRVSATRADSHEFSPLYRHDFSHRTDLISPGARAILAGNILWHQGCCDVNLFELFFDAFFEGFRR
jgi:hypothetical protein